jgi:aryl-alcohol dehydrogenase-like predicted oxidoreductase
MSKAKLGGRFTFPGTRLTVNRIGYGAMQLAGPGVWGPPKDPDAAIAVLREAVAAGVNHIDTSDYYGPHVTNQIIRQALHPYPAGLVIVTKLGGRRPPDKSWQPANSPQDLVDGVHDNLRNLGLDALDIVNYRVMGSGRHWGRIGRRAGDGARGSPTEGTGPAHWPEQRHRSASGRGADDHRRRVRAE